MIHYLLFFAVSLLLIGAGCRAPAVGITDLPTLPAEESAVVSVVEPVTAPTPTPAAEGEKPPQPVAAPVMKKPYYVSFTQAQYEKARAEGRPILLYFYASWCPICREEEPIIRADVEASALPIAGFRVHFNDTEVDDAGMALAKQFGVTYQHTTVILDAKGEEVERFIGPVESSVRAAAFQKAAR